MKETEEISGKPGRKTATTEQSKYKKKYMLWLKAVLVEQRENMGRLNHRQMAEALGIKRASYSCIEAGGIAASPELLHRLAEVLGMEFYMGFREKESKKIISEFSKKDLVD